MRRQHHQHQDAPAPASSRRGWCTTSMRQRAERPSPRCAGPCDRLEPTTRLHQRGVGGQARQHLAGLRGLEELGALPQHMRIDRVAQVGGDALAEPADACRSAPPRTAPSATPTPNSADEMVAQRQQPLAGAGRSAAPSSPPSISAAQRQREHQRRRRRQHQEQQRPARCGRGRAAGRAAAPTAPHRARRRAPWRGAAAARRGIRHRLSVAATAVAAPTADTALTIIA